MSDSGSQPIRILFTGSRGWKDREAIREALERELKGLPMDRPVVLVHGDCPSGGDSQVDSVWMPWHQRWPTLFELPERHQAQWFDTPLKRNQHMVDLGAFVCIAAATHWASGTGHCARAARKAGIRVVDIGVDTRIEARPKKEAA